MTHPVWPDREVTSDVFRALVETLPEPERKAWMDRYADARMVERKRRVYDDEYTASLMGVKRFGQ